MADNNMDNTNGTAPENTNAAPAPTPAATPTVPQEPVDMTMKKPEGMAIESHKSHTLAIVIGVLVILAALVLGGLYLWGAILDRQQADDAAMMEEVLLATGDQGHIPVVSAPNDELSTLEADVESTDLDAMEAELNAIDAEIEASS